MLSRTCLLVLPALLLPVLAAAQTVPAASPPPAALFFSPPVVSRAALSPDGTRVAMTHAAPGGRDRLVMLDLATFTPRVVLALQDTDIPYFRWINDRRLVMLEGDRQSAAADQRGVSQFTAVDADGDNYVALRGLRAHALYWQTDGEHVFVKRWESQDFTRLYRVDSRRRTDPGRELDAPPWTTDWLLDHQGQLRAVITAQDDRQALRWRDPASGAWKLLHEQDRFTTELHVVAPLPDGQLLIARAPPSRDTQALYAWNPAVAEPPAKPLLAVAGFDVLPHERIWHGERLLGLRFLADAEVTWWFDEGMKRLQADIDRRLPATANQLTPPQQGESPWLLVRSHSDRQPTRYQVYDRRSGKLTLIGASHPEVQPARMGAMRFARYRARDGLEIPAYLTLPPGRSASDAQRLPLVVLVHGGPWVRGGHWTWQPEVQFLASRGYAVLQPEFRGSTGFGAKHHQAGFRQWGQAMQDDLADGVRWAVDQGVADPARVCIVGSSYGGYAALMGLVRQADVFRCAASFAGLGELERLFDSRSWSDSSTWQRHGLPRLVGDRKADWDRLREYSPLQQAARIKGPLLLGHGKIDERVPVSHSEDLAAALKPHNPQVQLVVYEREGHGLSAPENRIDWWTRVERFLAEHLAERPAASR